MQVSYTTTLDDYVAYNRHVVGKSAIFRAVLLIGWLGIAGVALVSGVLLAFAEDLWPVGLKLAIFGVIYGAIFPLLWWPLLSWLVRAFAKGRGTRGMLGPITLILTEETLTDITETTRSEVKWKNIKGVDVAANHTFIFVTGLLAAIVPRRGFEREEDYEAVSKFAVAHAPRDGLGEEA
jgi:hypothetical protein